MLHVYSMLVSEFKSALQNVNQNHKIVIHADKNNGEHEHRYNAQLLLLGGNEF